MECVSGVDVVSECIVEDVVVKREVCCIPKEDSC